MDTLELILERINASQEQRDVFLKQAEAEEAKISKLETLYDMLEDPATGDLMRDVVVNMAVQNGAQVPDGNTGGATGERHYVGMQRVREYVAAMPAGQPFTVHDIFQKSIEHMPPNPKLRHPEFEKQRKGSISIALSSMAKCSDLELVKPGRGRDAAVYKKPEAK